jgi:hypothetical protein
MTVFEMQMGMVDRGADLTWLSQYPHEQEVLLPPLTGIEALSSDVDGGLLKIQARLSLNLASHTLEDVISRRRKMLMDMSENIKHELRDATHADPKLGHKEREALATFSVRLLQESLRYGPLSESFDWFMDDDNFEHAMMQTIGLQTAVIQEAPVLLAALEKPELNFRGRQVGNNARVMLLGGFVHCRKSAYDVMIDLRDSSLSPNDGKQLAALMAQNTKLTSLDVRSNETLGAEACDALIQVLKHTHPLEVQPKGSTHVVRSLCGVTTIRSAIDVPRIMAPCDTALVTAELECANYAEGISASMSGKASAIKDVHTLNRRSQQSTDFSPLIWAAKINHPLILCRRTSWPAHTRVARTAAWPARGLG